LGDEWDKPSALRGYPSSASSVVTGVVTTSSCVPPLTLSVAATVQPCCTAFRNRFSKSHRSRVEAGVGGSHARDLLVGPVAAFVESVVPERVRRVERPRSVLVTG